MIILLMGVKFLFVETTQVSFVMDSISDSLYHPLQRTEIDGRVKGEGSG